MEIPKPVNEAGRRAAIMGNSRDRRHPPLVSLISYIDRNTLALLSPTILRETGMSAEQHGYVISAFLIACTVANPLWGTWLDRVSLRVRMIVAVAFWTGASVSHAFVDTTRQRQGEYA